MDKHNKNEHITADKSSNYRIGIGFDKLWAMPMTGVEKLPLETNWMPEVLKDADEIQRINNHTIKPGDRIVNTYPFIPL